jgi:Xaa-Pro aminopeptidase
MENRIAELRRMMAERGLDALLITKDENQRYLEGFNGSECYLLADMERTRLIADSRYTESARSQCRSAEIVPHRAPYPPYYEVIAEICAREGIRELGFEEACVSYEQYSLLEGAASKKSVKLLPAGGMCERIRAVKDAGEADCIRRACAIADKALEKLLPSIKAGVTELELVSELEYLMTGAGADGKSFSTMVLFGAKSASPHAVPTHDARLKAGDFILIDYGCKYRGYCSDTTRTFVFGKASDKQRDCYGRVLESQIAGVNAVRAGAAARDVDAVSRGMLEGEGCFTYGLGHGVGLEIHEIPFMRPTSETILESGMTVTVEPGIYIPGWGGIRVEDTVLVTDGGREIMTEFPKTLMEL